MAEQAKDPKTQLVAKLEAELAKLREEYNKLKASSAKRNLREAKVAQVVRNLSTLMDFLSALEEKLPNAQQAILAAANGHELPKNVLFESAETLGKLAMRARRLSAELTVEES